MIDRPGPVSPARVWAFGPAGARRRADRVATEEPLEIRVRAGGEKRPVAVTMRTPGADFELAAGFLFAEGLVGSGREIRRISYCADPEVAPEDRPNVVLVELGTAELPDLGPLERHFTISSACGVCGKSSLEALRARGLRPVGSGPIVDPGVLRSLPDKLRRGQGIFRSTGGLHAAGLFTSNGELLAVREDVGRHNALDKLIGWALLQGRLPLRDRIVMVSGRTSYEIVQKTVSAGAPIVGAVSAPSSLAVDLAASFGLTLIGFLRGESFNVYAHPERVGAGVAVRAGRGTSEGRANA